MIRLALPNKGRLAEETRDLFEAAGFPVRTRSERALSATLGDTFEAIFVRTQDIPEFVSDGAADAGITGWDIARESGRALDELLDLGFGRCRLVVAADADSGIDSLDDITGAPRVATVFPRLTREFFRDAGRAIELVPVSGSVEIAPHLGIADIIVDLTSTGSTLRVNGLREVATVLESSARLLTRADGLDRGRRAELDELADVLASVVRARDRRYVMANLPRAALPRIREVLPGLNGPTVTDILTSGEHVAVHAVVAADRLGPTIRGLKGLGAEGILVTRIERLMP